MTLLEHYKPWSMKRASPKEQLLGQAEIETHQDLVWTYKPGKELVKSELMKELPTQMRRFHNWYMRIKPKESDMIGVRIKDED